MPDQDLLKGGVGKCRNLFGSLKSFCNDFRALCVDISKTGLNYIFQAEQLGE